MSTIDIEVNETVLQELVFDYLCKKLGGIGLTPKDVKIEVKSKQNYRAEWERASYRAVVHKSI